MITVDTWKVYLEYLVETRSKGHKLCMNKYHATDTDMDWYMDEGSTYIRVKSKITKQIQWKFKTESS